MKNINKGNLNKGDYTLSLNSISKLQKVLTKSLQKGPRTLNCDA